MMLTYNQELAQLVHCLRVDPFDVVLQNAIADLIEQHGKPGMENRTTKFLRNEKIPPSSLDNLAAYWLSEVLRYKGPNKNMTGYPAEYETVGNFGVYLHTYNNRIILEPQSYYTLWKLAYKYRKEHAPPPDVVAEARLVNRDRIKLARQRKQPERTKLLSDNKEPTRCPGT